MKSTAERARSEIVSLATAGLDLTSFGEASMDALTKAVPFQYACWAPVDPATQLMTGGLKWGGIGDEHDEQWIFHEYEGPDPFNFHTVAGRPDGVGTAMEEYDGDTRRSPRFTDLYHLWDVTDEARIALQTDGAIWGFLALFRDGPGSSFTREEQEYLSAVRAALAVGLRAGMLASATTELLPALRGPVVLVVDSADEVVSVSASAYEGLAHLTDEPVGESPLPFGLRVLVGAARRFGRGLYPTVPRMRLRSRSGEWLVAHASPLLSRDGISTDVVITLEEARPPEIVPLVVAALGLTGRERDVVDLILRGMATSEMAATLNLSAWTVQDHMKSIFEKADVRSRRELLAKVFYDQYAPVSSPAPRSVRPDGSPRSPKRQPRRSDMSDVERNKAVIRRFVEEVQNQKNWDVYDELNDPDFFNHSAPPEMASREGSKVYLAGLLNAFPECWFSIEDMIAEGDQVVTKKTFHGTHTADFAGIPPTGREVTLQYVDIMKVRDGLITEHWLSMDQLSFMQQLGVIPTQ